MPTFVSLPRRTLVAGGLLVIAVAFTALVSYQNTIRPRGVVIHHSAMGSTLCVDAAPVDTIAYHHRRRGFGLFYYGRVYHIGYHYVIDPSGRVDAGRPDTSVGAHTVGYNDYIGVLVVGNFSRRDDAPVVPCEPRLPTREQLTALESLIRDLQRRYDIPPAHIATHSALTGGTACPGDAFAWNDWIHRFVVSRTTERSP